MWAAFKRVIKPKGAIVLTASQPFTSALVMSNPVWFRHEWIWDKKLSGNFMLASRQPLKQHESILVFGDGVVNYYPLMRAGVDRIKGGGVSKLWEMELTKTRNDQYYPQTILEFPNTDRINNQHPTQKPLALMAYLVRTYTRPGELVLDPTCGSGTTALAARNEGRRYLAGDTDAGYCEIARARLAAPYTPPLFPDDTPAEPLPAQTSFLE